ncbi:MAG: hypothetical protein FIA82_08570 [Melioribacter sp.]|nr:hypothetical protein [Melioribacter sp.]
MKRLMILFFVLASLSQIGAQWDLNFAMGLDFKSSPSFRDYVNSYYAPSGNQIATFKSSVGFETEADYKIHDNFAIGIEYNLQIDSYTTPIGNGGVYEISYNQHRPSVIAYYVIPGNGYQFKFGGGLGYRYVALSEKVFTSTNYNASGVGFLMRAIGNTLLSKDFYALIGVDLRYDLPGELSNGSKSLINNASGEKLNLNSISVGIYLGITLTL